MALDPKRALAAYVSGRSGGWDTELKSRAGDGVAARPVRPATPGAAESPGGTSAADPPESESGGQPAVALHRGVPVPERLRFGRGPGTWRRKLREASNA